MGGKARRHEVGRDLRVLHARADRARVCANADEVRGTAMTTEKVYAKAVSITVDESRRVSGLLQAPADARACYVFAHGAGAGMTHPFMAATAEGLAERTVATLRYQFPYMEEGSKRPQTPKVAHTNVPAPVS